MLPTLIWESVTTTPLQASDSPASYGGQLHEAISRGHTQPRAFTNDFPGRARHSDAGIFPRSSNFDASYRDLYRDSFMTDRSIGRADGGPSVEQYYTGGAPMWAEYTQFDLDSGLSSFSTHSSPGYMQRELPNATYRPQGHARHFSSDYIDHGNNFNHSAFAHSATLNHTSPTHPSWHTEPTPSIVQTAPTPFQSPTPAHLFNTFGHHPPIASARGETEYASIPWNLAAVNTIARA
ncbi:hypothetical protein B0H16DRAFT_1879601 [Mycena metata]|uniref:Uncharacterized protein n=1 Tax=Mycena metata TaxID=1033252 RepID=A0AAD7NV22_9AGAR|nr:hypothetical protein B0H16DRAFT_1879601 [Mycena metata]